METPAMDELGAVCLDDKKSGPEAPCPACDGAGVVCCETWGVARARAGEDLRVSGVGLPLWPLAEEVEMSFCPFCGERFAQRSK